MSDESATIDGDRAGFRPAPPTHTNRHPTTNNDLADNTPSRTVERSRSN